MRKVLLVVISLLLLADLAGTGLVVSSGRGTLSSELASFGLSSGRAWFSIGSLSFGEIGEKGMVKTFSNPHGVNLSLRPYVTRPGNGEGWNGFVLDYERMGIIFSVDERPLAGISFSGEWVEAAMMAVYGDGGGRGFHDDAGESQEFTTVYAGFDLSPGAFRLTALMSYAAEVGSRSFQPCLSYAVLPVCSHGGRPSKPLERDFPCHTADLDDVDTVHQTVDAAVRALV